MSEAPAARKEPSLGRKLLFCFILAGAVVVVAEGAIRTWAYFFRSPYERFNLRTGRLELVPNVRRVSPGGNEFLINSRGFLGPEFDAVPARGVSRVIAIGDSCTFGGGIWRSAYPAIAERALNANGSTGHRFEVINAGIEGYNSELALARLREELLELRPRIVTIYIGWNDLMKIDPDNAAATGRWAGLGALMEKSYFVRAYRKVLFYHLRPLLFPPGVEPDARGAGRHAGFEPLSYQQNLTGMIELLEKHDVETVLMTLPTAVRRGMTAEELRREKIFFPYFAGAYGVEEFLELHGAYNRVIRRVAASTGVALVDLEEVFGGQSQSGRLFWDTMHPSDVGHRLIAQALHPLLASITAERR